MNEYIYGVWRGLPARQNRKRGTKECLRDGSWQQLGVGYETEFQAFPDQASPDAWDAKHEPVTTF